MADKISRLREKFAVLKPGMGIDRIPVTPSLYQELNENYNSFNGHILIAEHEFCADWATWERHPLGDELVYLLAGQVTFIIRAEHGDEHISLEEPGTYIVVPGGHWHTAKTDVATKLLFITPGAGTQHEKDPDDAVSDN